MQLILEKVRKGIGYRLKGKDTTAKAKREKSDLELMNVPPVYKEDGPEWAGQALWVTRGTRPEALFAARRLSTRLTVWTALEDADALYT